MTGIPAHRFDPDFRTCWCGKPWPCNLPGQRQLGTTIRGGGPRRPEDHLLNRLIEFKDPPGNDTDGLGAGALRSTVGSGRKPRAGRVSGMVPRSWIRRKQRSLALWIRKHLTRTITRIEHGHGPGTLRVGDPITFGTEWTCGRCGEKTEW